MYSPTAPWGVPAVLEHVPSVALIHRDKHGPALGIYGREPFSVDGLHSSPSDESGSQPLLVPFAIPPMLARWDRALSELREVWDESSLGPFPVPAAEPRLSPADEDTTPEPVDAEDAPALAETAAPIEE